MCLSVVRLLTNDLLVMCLQVVTLKKNMRALEEKISEQEEELDDQAGTIQQLEQVRTTTTTTRRVRTATTTSTTRIAKQ